MLLAEDEPLVRSMVATVLRDQGYEVLEASNGEEALRVARGPLGENIHLLLTDVVMPVVGGPELAENMRMMHPNIKIHTLYIRLYRGLELSSRHVGP